MVIIGKTIWIIGFPLVGIIGKRIVTPERIEPPAPCVAGIIKGFEI